MKHKDSGYICLVIHYNDDGTLGPQCIKCENCRKWIRPENMDDDDCVPIGKPEDKES